MSRNARKCDRCGKLYEVYKKSYEGMFGDYELDGIVVLDKARSASQKSLSERAKDLCEECMDSFVDWFKAGIPTEEEPTEPTEEEKQEEPVPTE